MSRSDAAGTGELVVVAIVADASAADLIRRTLQQTGDRVSLAPDLAEGLTRVSAEVPDVAFVDLTLGGNAGLAVVHHIRALAPQTAVFGITRPDRLELAMQAAALGSRGTLVLPLSGDDLLTALSEVRARRAEQTAQRRPSGTGFGEQRLATLFGEIAELSSVSSRRVAAEQLAPVLAAGFGLQEVLVYLAAGEASRQFLRVAALPSNEEAPAFAEELELLRYAAQRGFEILRLAMRREQLGLILFRGGTVPSTSLVTGAGFAATLMLALVGAREQSSRGAMKDPDSSAYTFAYFVDVAGREIDMARRYGRRFALATISVQEVGNVSATAREPTVQAAESVLAAVRDTDVLARVDAHEFYLLLPETGGIGAQACRRRVLDQLVGSLDVTMGLSAFPHDGTDLSRLLRVARHRAEASSRSTAELFSLNRLPLAAMVDVLLGPVALQAAREDRELEAPRYIELLGMDAVGVALSALREASRAGDARVVATQHPGISIGGAVRAEVLREMEGIRLDVIDVSGIAGAENTDILVIVAEYICYVLVGRSEGGTLRAVHAADPLLADAVLRRLSEASGARLLD